MKLTSLSIFFPVYNEEDNIAKLAQKVFEIIPVIVDKFEIIFVNDGSTDNTKERLSEIALRYNNIKIINHEKNKGYGGALRSGFLNAQYDYVFFTDGDNQFDLGQIDRLTGLIESCDVAIGFRKIRKDPFYRLFNAKAYNLLVRILFGLNVRDIDCAFKLIKKEVLGSLNLKSESQFISAELLIKAKKGGFIIKEFGVDHYPRVLGKATGNSPRAIINSFKELFKLWEELRK